VPLGYRLPGANSSGKGVPSLLPKIAITMSQPAGAGICVWKVWWAL
jgi:hypothetical protein